MGSWRDSILREFAPKASRLTLVADPDGLLLEEGVLEGIRKRGFELIAFEDSIAFRYAYESKFRAHWDKGEDTDLVVVLRLQAGELDALPYDLLQAGRKLSFNLGDIFQNLSYPVISALDRGDLEALHTAQSEHAPGQLGENATKDFILRHVFEIAPEFIKQPADFLRTLLRIHYRAQLIPDALNKRLIQLLERNSIFESWPIKDLVPDKEKFYGFLQERWPIFLDRLAAQEGTTVREKPLDSNFVIAGPINLPFEHHDVRVYINDLFLEGFLHPISHSDAAALSGTWVSVGLAIDPSEDRSRRLEKLLESISSSIPAQDARHGDWLHFARSWAELSVLHHVEDQGSPVNAGGMLAELQSRVDETFVSWLYRRYAGLASLPAAPPVMLHHVPRHLARQLETNRNTRVALLIVDGLALEQWIIVREALAIQKPDFRFREGAVFAWVPTLTSISRQAAFAGKPPLFFPESLYTTDKEPTLWAQFWAEHGISKNEIIYAKGLGDGDPAQIGEMLSDSRIRVAGLVVDKVDRIMHGMELGMAGMHNQVRQWARLPYLTELLDLLLNRGFSIFLTSDHGNIEAQGFGRPAEGVIADIKGERVRIYPDRVLRKKVKERFPSALDWEPIGLPEDCHALLAPGRKAFIREGDRIVGHGGVSIEELIVPFIEIERKN